MVDFQTVKLFDNNFRTLGLRLSHDPIQDDMKDVVGGAAVQRNRASGTVLVVVGALLRLADILTGLIACDWHGSRHAACQIYSGSGEKVHHAAIAFTANPASPGLKNAELIYRSFPNGRNKHKHQRLYAGRSINPVRT